METTGTLTEAQAERLIDSRVQSRLTSDSAYRNAATADEQAQREQEITAEEWARIDGAL